jgi:3-hydroxybutyryl-CoA dehydratase
MAEDMPKTNTGRFFEDMEIGEFVEMVHTITEDDIELFARVSGDYNPLHMDEDYARTTQFEGRIAHGALTASYISALLGNDLPGPGAIFTGLELRFKRPVRIGDEVTARAEVAEKIERGNRVELKVSCSVAGKPVVLGTAQVVAPRRAR